MSRHLIHVGYPRTGTTFLRHWFGTHHEIAYVEGGIAGFSGPSDLARQAAALREIKLRVTSCEALVAPHSSVGGGGRDHFELNNTWRPQAAEYACRELSALFSDAAVLIVTRGFRSMMTSSYSQYVRSGGTYPIDRLLAETFQVGTIEDDKTTRAYLDYDRVIFAYSAAFGGNSVLVMPYELLRDDPVAFTRELETRFSLGHVAPAAEALNASLSDGETHWYPKIGRGLKALPVGSRLRRKLMGLHAHATMHNTLAPLVRALQSVGDPPRANVSPLLEHAVERHRGLASCLRDKPLFAAYDQEYLL